MRLLADAAQDLVQFENTEHLQPVLTSSATLVDDDVRSRNDDVDSHSSSDLVKVESNAGETGR